jgi:hypothetical protein
MTPSLNQSAIKGLVGRKMSKNVKFMGEDIKISKLSIAQIKQIQELAKAQNEKGEVVSEDDEAFALVRFVIRSAVEGADQLTDADFLEFSMGDTTTLSNQILEFSGMLQSGN